MRRLLSSAALAAALCGAQAASLSVDVRTQKGEPLSDAVVWLEAATPQKLKSPDKMEIHQLKLEFVPLVTVVPVGTKIAFPNDDTVKHHVYSFSPAKTFEIQLYSGSPAAPTVFDRPGVVVLGCNIHDWMEAYVLVVDSNWYAKSPASGRVAIDGLAPGRYTVHAWHPYLRSASAGRSLDVGAATDKLQQTWDLDLDVPARKPRRPVDARY